MLARPQRQRWPEIGQGRQIRLCYLRGHCQDSESIGCETKIRLGVAHLPAGEPLGLDVGLRSCRQLEGGRLRGRETKGLYCEIVSPRREITEEAAADGDIADWRTIGERQPVPLRRRILGRLGRPTRAETTPEPSPMRSAGFATARR